MSKEPLRIAFVSREHNRFPETVLHGLSLESAASGKRGRPAVVREFDVKDPARTPAGFEAWDPDAVVTHLGSTGGALMDALRGGRRPMVHATAVADRPGEAIVLSEYKATHVCAHDYLNGLGYERVELLAVSDEPVTQWMIDRYKRCCASLGTTPRVLFAKEQFVRTYLDRDSPIWETPAIRRWVDGLDGPVGVVVQQGYFAPHFCRLIQQMGVRVPEDVAIIGPDGFDVCLLSEPAISSYHLNALGVGRLAMQTAIEMLQNDGQATEGEAEAGGDNVRYAPGEPRIIERGSTRLQGLAGVDIPAALDFIEHYAMEGITQQDIVDCTQGVNRKTFAKHFKASTEMTPAQAIREKKRSAAKQMLRDSEVSIIRLAQVCGYCDEIEFRKRFRLAEGCSPLAYRKTHRG